MPEHVAIARLAGLTVLAAVTALWLVFFQHLLRRRRMMAAVRNAVQNEAIRTVYRELPAAPGPSEPANGPEPKPVELTPEEQAAFAGLVRQFGDSR
ncbi:hypothetical protein [Streptomyces sp. YIM S03343]